MYKNQNYCENITNVDEWMNEQTMDGWKEGKKDERKDGWGMNKRMQNINSKLLWNVKQTNEWMNAMHKFKIALKP